jgi:carbon-monoxide dehydrogenase medium subunit
MKAAGFQYERPNTLTQAIQLLASSPDARVLAGGQSLLPAMNMRLASPEMLVDIQDIPGLKSIEETEKGLRIGALVTHGEIQASDLVKRKAPLLARAVPYVAHVGIRNRGTIGGSLSLADPAAEYPAVVVASDAVIEIQGPEGLRKTNASRFFKGLYATDLEASDILTAVEFHQPKPNETFIFEEFARRKGDYATVGLAGSVVVSGTTIESARIVFFAVGSQPVLAEQAAKALTGCDMADKSSLEKAVQLLDGDLDPMPDLQANRHTKLHLAKTLLVRALFKQG